MNKYLIILSLFTVINVSVNCVADEGSVTHSSEKQKRSLYPENKLDELLSQADIVKKDYQMELNSKSAEENFLSQLLDIGNPFEFKLPKKRQPISTPEIEKVTSPLSQKFNDLNQSETRATASRNASRSKPNRPDLKISGWVWDTDRPQAIINNQSVNVGDTINNGTVIEIQKSGIRIRVGEKEFFYSGDETNIHNEELTY